MSDRIFIGKARIKTGAHIFQDHHFASWKDGGEVFDVYDVAFDGRKDLIADGYGNLEKPGAYGNGSLFVKDADIVFVDPPWQPTD